MCIFYFSFDMYFLSELILVLLVYEFLPELVYLFIYLKDIRLLLFVCVVLHFVFLVT